MNTLSITAGTLARRSTAAEAIQSLLQRWFKNLRFHGTARRESEPIAGVDSQSIDEMGWEPDKYHSPLYELAESHPHVIAASLFSSAAKRQ